MKLDTIINNIQHANREEIDSLLDAVMTRKRQLYPDWGIAYYAYNKKEPEDLERIFQLIRKNAEK